MGDTCGKQGENEKLIQNFDRKTSRNDTTRAVWKVRELAAVRRCYAEGGGDCYAKL